MKKLKSIFVAIALFATSFSVTSCGLFSNMSYDDAYNVGYGIGRMLGSIDN